MAKSDVELKDEFFEKAYAALKVDFPQEAYVTDKSRGFQLIGIRGAFIIERLNEVFGLLGYGWRFAHSRFDEVTYTGKRSSGTEYLTEVALQYRIMYTGEGCHPVNWNGGSWAFDTTREAVWSEPVLGVGGNNVGPGSTPISDAKKGAVSNALSKAASRLGVGIMAYKGQLVLDGQEVVVKGEDSVVTQLAEAGAAMVDMLKVLSRTQPDEFQALRAHSAVEQYFLSNVLTPMGAYISEHELTGFVADNYKRVLHNDKLKSFEGMTMREAAFLAEVLVSIVNVDDFGWKDALEVTDIWDGNKTWNYLYNEWIGAKSESE